MNENKTHFQDNILLTKPVRVIIFKDGYCMFIKKLTGKLDSNNKAIIKSIPEAMVLGSFWVVPENGKLISIVAKQKIITRKALQETEKHFVLQFDSNMAENDVEVLLYYFAPGIRWIPTYRIVLEENDKCHLMMQAEILNEAEDLNGVPVDLVVGVPNFRFKDVISPLSLETTLRNALQSSAPQLMSQVAVSNVFATQRMGESYGNISPSSDSPSGVPSLPPDLVGEGSQDLFLYKIPSINLQVGERAAIPLVSTEQTFRHLYTWNVHFSRSSIDNLPSTNSHISPVKLSKNDVWHQIELTNQSDVPWTTGAALIMEGYLPLSQELLTYTPIRGSVQIPLSVAVDIRGSYSEMDIQREINAIRFDGYDYVKITKKGTLQVINYKNEPVNIIISCDLGGNADSASLDGKIEISSFQNDDWSDFRGHKALTGHSKIIWKLQLASKEQKEVTCQYYYYIR